MVGCHLLEVVERHDLARLPEALQDDESGAGLHLLADLFRQCLGHAASHQVDVVVAILQPVGDPPGCLRDEVAALVAGIHHVIVEVDALGQLGGLPEAAGCAEGDQRLQRPARQGRSPVEMRRSRWVGEGTVDRFPGERRENRAVRDPLAERDTVIGDGALGLRHVVEVEPAGRIRGREDGDVLLVAIRGLDVPEDLHLAARPVGAMQQEGAGQTALYRFARQREGILLPRLQPDVLGCQHVGARTRDDFIIPALVLLLAPEHLPWGGAPAVWHSIAVRVFIETGVAE